MGYTLNSIDQLPFDPKTQFYIFVVHDGIDTAAYKEIAEKFYVIAEQITKNSIIAKGFRTFDWSREVAETYFGAQGQEILQRAPGLVLTDTHPDELTEDSLRIFVSMKDAEEKFGSQSNFFRALIDFTKTKDADFLTEIQKKDSDTVKVIKFFNDAAILKPAFLGMGVDLNKGVLEKWIKWRSKRKAS